MDVILETRKIQCFEQKSCLGNRIRQSLKPCIINLFLKFDSWILLVRFLELDSSWRWKMPVGHFWSNRFPHISHVTMAKLCMSGTNKVWCINSCGSVIALEYIKLSLVTIYVDSVLQYVVQHEMTINSATRSLLVTMSGITVLAISIQASGTKMGGY